MKSAAGNGSAWWLALAAALIMCVSWQAAAEEAVDADDSVFSGSTPVNQEDLAKVHGTGPINSSTHLHLHVTVILWDELPKAKPAPSTPSEGNGPHTAQTSTSLR